MLKALQEAVWFGEFSSFTLWPNHMVSISTSTRGWRWDCPGCAQQAPAEVANNGAAMSQHFHLQNTWQNERPSSIRHCRKGKPENWKKRRWKGKESNGKQLRSLLDPRWPEVMDDLHVGFQLTELLMTWRSCFLQAIQVDIFCGHPHSFPGQGGLRTASTQLSSWMPWAGTPSSIMISHSILF